MLLAENMFSGGWQSFSLVVLVACFAYGLFVQLLWYDPKLRDQTAEKLKGGIRRWMSR